MDQEEDRYVGMFYFVHKSDGNGIPINVSEVLNRTRKLLWTTIIPPGEKGKCVSLGRTSFGYYQTKDEWVIRRHIEMLSIADIDFWYSTPQTVLHSESLQEDSYILNEYIQEGWKVPRVVYYTNTKSENNSEIYEDIYQTGFCSDFWFYWEGKPLIIGLPGNVPGDSGFLYLPTVSMAYRTFRREFPWMAFERPQHVFRDKMGRAEVISVSVAQHPQIKFGDSAMYGETRIADVPFMTDTAMKNLRHFFGALTLLSNRNTQ